MWSLVGFQPWPKQPLRGTRVFTTETQRHRGGRRKPVWAGAPSSSLCLCVSVVNTLAPGRANKKGRLAAAFLELMHSSYGAVRIRYPDCGAPPRSGEVT
jgi:hypothetical protein